MNTLTAASKTLGSLLPRGAIDLYFERLRPRLASVRLRPYCAKDTVVVCGIPRSGSTWLGELLSTIPRSSILWEPLLPNNGEEASRLPLHWREYRTPEQNDDELREYLDLVFAGKVLNAWTLSQAALPGLWYTRTWVVKFCRANLLLPWMARRFHTRMPVLIVRHPCAVIASQMRHKAWWRVDLHDCPNFFHQFPEYLELARSLKTPEEILAANWCIDYKVPLGSAYRSHWLTVTYERLFLEGEAELSRIFRALSYPMPKDVKSLLRKPSASTDQRSGVYDGSARLTDWRKVIKPDQRQRILRVMRHFEIDLYDEGPEPDYDQLA